MGRGRLLGREARVGSRLCPGLGGQGDSGQQAPPQLPTWPVHLGQAKVGQTLAYLKIPEGLHSIEPAASGPGPLPHLPGIGRYGWKEKPKSLSLSTQELLPYSSEARDSPGLCSCQHLSCLPSPLTTSVQPLHPQRLWEARMAWQSSGIRLNPCRGNQRAWVSAFDKQGQSGATTRDTRDEGQAGDLAGSRQGRKRGRLWRARACSVQ